VEVDYIYWSFSAAAQSISAFVALLLTGYTLVHMQMDAAREKDDSLEEVHANLLKRYHIQLTILATITGAAIVFSLLVAYYNRTNCPVSPWIQLFVATVDAAAIAGGLYFVVSW